jgi:hypothetical protein
MPELPILINNMVIHPTIAFINPNIEMIVTMIARLLDLGNSTRNSSKTLSLTLPLISRKRCHPFVDGFSPLQKRSKILMKYGCHQNIEMHARTCDSQRNGVLC